MKKYCWILTIVFVISVVLLSTTYYDKQKELLDYNRKSGRIAFDTMMYLDKELRHIVQLYEEGKLSDEVLNEHNRFMYNFGLYSMHIPLIGNDFHAVEFIGDSKGRSMGGSIIIYKELINLFHNTYLDISKGEHEDEILYMYEVFSSESFHKKFEKIMKKLQ